MTTPSGRTPLSPAAALALAAWFGLVAGYGELAYLGLRKFYQGLFVFQPLATLWLTPLATLLLALAVTLAGSLLLRPWGGATARRVSGWCAALLLAGWLFLFPPLHRGAALLIALGAGIQLARTGLAERAWARRLVRVTLPLLLLALAGTAATTTASGLVAARRAGAALPAAPAGAPNVLLIILDTVRAMSMSVYGHPHPTTPALERRAASGVRFAHPISPAPWTLPSHASMFTGKDAHRLGTDWYVALDDTTLTLAEALRDRGWRTGGFVANLPYTGRETGLDRGFLHYEDHPLSLPQLLASSSIVRTVANSRPLRRALDWHELVVRKQAPEVGAAFLRWVDREPERPFFAFLNYYDAHNPYLPPERYRRRFLPPGVEPVADITRQKGRQVAWDSAVIQGARASYEGAIAWLDDELERLFQELDRRGMLQRTLVIITSDHGEEFAEHGLIDHGNSLYRPALEVPLLLWLPGRVPQGAVVETPVSTREIPATVADLLDLDPVFPGQSLARWWSPGADSIPPPVWSEVRHAPRLPEWYPSTRGDMLAVLHDGLRYIRNGDGVAEVYDFRRDPAERHDLAADTTLLAGDVLLRRRIADLAAMVQAAQSGAP